MKRYYILLSVFCHLSAFLIKSVSHSSSAFSISALSPFTSHMMRKTGSVPLPLIQIKATGFLSLSLKITLSPPFPDSEKSFTSRVSFVPFVITASQLSIPYFFLRSEDFFFQSASKAFWKAALSFVWSVVFTLSTARGSETPVVV